jgi:hypothetical protein
VKILNRPVFGKHVKFDMMQKYEHIYIFSTKYIHVHLKRHNLSDTKYCAVNIFEKSSNYQVLKKINVHYLNRTLDFVAEDKLQWQALVNMVVHRWCPQKVVNFIIS